MLNFVASQSTSTHEKSAVSSLRQHLESIHEAFEQCVEAIAMQVGLLKHPLKVPKRVTADIATAFEQIQQRL
jgi:hypothetical protein